MALTTGTSSAQHLVVHCRQHLEPRLKRRAHQPELLHSVLHAVLLLYDRLSPAASQAKIVLHLQLRKAELLLRLGAVHDEQDEENDGEGEVLRNFGQGRCRCGSGFVEFIMLHNDA